MRRIMIVYGTRPEAIKVAPVITRLKGAAHLTPVVVVTGQHGGILDQVNEVFGIEPEYDLRIHATGQTLSTVTSRAIAGLDRVLLEARPDAVVVQGDTTTTLTGALAAFYHRVPVVHLEAGLRTGDPAAPFPEEINRRLTAQLADLHLAATAAGQDNLLGENVPPENILVTGNTVIDALGAASRAGLGYREPELRGLDGDGRKVILVTAHRRESWGRGMDRIGRALSRIAVLEPGARIVIPMHPNPTIKVALLPHLKGHRNVTVTGPLAYGDFARLLGRAHLVLTDSGGIQEEAPSLGTPVLVTRDTTERPEGVAAGVARLVGTDPDRIVAEVTKLLRSPAERARMAGAANPYGDGRAAERAVAALRHMFGLGPPAEAFRPERPATATATALNGSALV